LSRHNASRKPATRGIDKPGAAAEASHHAQAPDLTRATSAMVRATGDVQESVLRRTGLLHKEAAHQLRMATNPAEFMAVQSALLMAGWQHSIQCTTDVANAWFAIGAAGGLPKKDRTSLN
jgi:hypothetical protein